MPNENKTPPPATTPNAPNFASTETIAIAQELSEIRQQLATIKKERDALKAEKETTVKDAKTAEVQKELDALKAENEKLKANASKRAEADTRQQQLAKLTGKIRDPEAALKLLTDELKDKDGQPDPEKIVAKYPFLAPEGNITTTAPSEPNTTTTKVPDLEKAVAAGDVAAINAAFEFHGGNK